MTFEKSAYWDKRAVHMVSHPSGRVEGVRYWRASYLDMIHKGLNHLSKKNINVLKVDLWNEGIAREREILSQIKRCNVNLYGIDISVFVCHQAKKKNPKIDVIQATIQRLPFKSNSFDLLLDLSTLDHISLYKVPHSLRDYNRVLRNKGILVLVFDCISVWKLVRILREALVYKPTYADDNYFFPPNLIKRIIEEIGFIILEEYALFTIGLIHFLLKMRLDRPIIYKLVRCIESTSISKRMKPFQRQYVVIAKNPD